MVAAVRQRSCCSAATLAVAAVLLAAGSARAAGVQLSGVVLGVVAVEVLSQVDPPLSSDADGMDGVDVGDRGGTSTSRPAVKQWTPRRRAGALAITIFYALLITIVFVFGIWAMRRFSMRYRDYAVASKPKPTANDDVWLMHRDPDSYDLGDDSVDIHDTSYTLDDSVDEVDLDEDEFDPPMDDFPNRGPFGGDDDSNDLDDADEDWRG